MEENISFPDNIIGYCYSCKDILLLKDDYIKANGRLYCIYCYKTEHNVVEELNFDY